MKRSIVVRWCAGLALGLIAAPVSAQTTVQGAVVVESQSDGLADRARRTMGAQVIVVDRVHYRYGWWTRPHYRVVTVYTDGVRFYRRPFGRTILRRIDVYERSGRYYIDEYQWKRHHHRYWENRRDDRDDRDDRGWGNDRDDDDRHGRGHDNGNHYGWDKDKDKDKNKH